MKRVYLDEYCNKYWEIWPNFKEHMINEHGLSPDLFVDKPISDAES